MNTIPRSLLLAVALAATSSLAAAQTFIVDAANGPGTNYTDLPAAVAAVPDGAVLLVRPGTYKPVRLNGKGMSILATAAGVTIASLDTNAVSVANLAANQAFTLRGVNLNWSSSSWFPVIDGVSLQACAGPVLLQAVWCVSWEAAGVAVFADACAAMTVRECSFSAAQGIHARNSQVAVENCTLHGTDAYYEECRWLCPGWGAGQGVLIEGGTVTMSRCAVYGGNDNFSNSPAPAVTLKGGLLRLCEDPSSVYAAGRSWGFSSTPPTPAIGGSAGTVVRAPGAALSGSHGGPAVATTLTDVVRPLPSLHTQPARPGGTVTADVTTPVGETVLLAVALPGRVTAVPGVNGSLWLDTATMVPLAVGVPRAGAPLQHDIKVPNMPSLIAVRFCWQAIAWSPTNGLRLSNPSTLAF